MHEFLDFGINIKEEGYNYTGNDDKVKAPPR
jgi:hypothetical protein